MQFRVREMCLWSRSVLMRPRSFSGDADANDFTVYSFTITKEVAKARSNISKKSRPQTELNTPPQIFELGESYGDLLVGALTPQKLTKRSQPNLTGR